MADETTIRELQAYEHIRRLAADYAHGVDKRDADRFGSVWCEDAEWQPMPDGDWARGREAIVTAIKAIWDGVAETHHWTANHSIEVDGDSATGLADADCVMCTPDGQLVPSGRHLPGRVRTARRQMGHQAADDARSTTISRSPSRDGMAAPVTAAAGNGELRSAPARPRRHGRQQDVSRAARTPRRGHRRRPRRDPRARRPERLRQVDARQDPGRLPRAGPGRRGARRRDPLSFGSPGGLPDGRHAVRAPGPRSGRLISRVGQLPARRAGTAVGCPARPQAPSVAVCGEDCARSATTSIPGRWSPIAGRVGTHGRGPGPGPRRLGARCHAARARRGRPRRCPGPRRRGCSPSLRRIAASRGRASCSSPTTSTRCCGSPIGSPCCATAGGWSRPRERAHPRPSRRADARPGAPRGRLHTPAATSATGRTPLLDVVRSPWRGRRRASTSTFAAGEVLGIAGLTGSGREEVAGLLAGRLPRGGHGQRRRSIAAARRSGRRHRRRAVLRAGRSGRQALLPTGTCPREPDGGRPVGVLADAADCAPARSGAKSSVGSTSSTIRTGQDRDRGDPAVGRQPAEGRHGPLAPGRRRRVLVLDEPTQGVDVGSKADIHRLVDQAVDTVARRSCCARPTPTSWPGWRPR